MLPLSHEPPGETVFDRAIQILEKLTTIAKKRLREYLQWTAAQAETGKRTTSRLGPTAVFCWNRLTDLLDELAHGYSFLDLSLKTPLPGTTAEKYGLTRMIFGPSSEPSNVGAIPFGALWAAKSIFRGKHHSEREKARLSGGEGGKLYRASASL